MKIKANISAVAAVKQGGNVHGIVEAEIDITQYTQAERDRLALEMQRDRNNVLMGYDRGILDAANLHAYLAACIERQATEDAERKARADKQRAERERDEQNWRAAFAARRVKTVRHNAPHRGYTITWESQEFDGPVGVYAPDDMRDEYIAWKKQLEAAYDAARAAAEQAADRKHAAAEAKMKEWIEQHGSKRLKACLREEIECQAIYRDERLKLERPGWQWAVKYSGDYEDPRNPPADALESLEVARKTAPDAKLAFWQSGIENEDGDEWRGYCAVAEFLGRKIALGLPDSILED